MQIQPCLLRNQNHKCQWLLSLIPGRIAIFFALNLRFMENNVGLLDTLVRYAVIIVLGVLFGITQYYFLVVLAIALFITAVSGQCPLYKMFGWNTAGGNE